jgi:uncharacterized membrane protein
MRDDQRKLAGVWATGAGLVLILGLGMPWIDRRVGADVIGVHASRVWWLLAAAGVGITAIGISLLSSQRSAKVLGWVLNFLAFIALVVALTSYVDIVRYASDERSLDASASVAGYGLTVVIFAAGATVVDAFILLVRAHKPRPVVEPSVPPPPS